MSQYLGHRFIVGQGSVRKQVSLTEPALQGIGKLYDVLLAHHLSQDRWRADAHENPAYTLWLLVCARWYQILYASLTTFGRGHMPVVSVTRVGGWDLALSRSNTTFTM